LGGIGKMQFSRIKALLRLSDEAMELADRHGLEEGVLRYVLVLLPEAQTEMVQQIIQLKLTGKQVKAICEQESSDETEDGDEKTLASDLRLIRMMRSVERQNPQTLVRTLMREEKSVHFARARLETMMSFLKQASQLLEETK